MSAPSDLRLVWIDLEMTGLNPATDAILEIAAVVTGADLSPLVQIERVVSAPEEFLERMSDRVRRMHTENGLLEAVRTSPHNLRDVEREVLTAIAPHVPAGEGLLAGNSVFHDWRFLAKHMPRLEQHLHFRHVDIGTVSALVNSWYPDLEYPPAPVNHRAMADVQASLDELRYYCKHAFRIDLAKLARR
ncbi:MAG TPA: oligoribonuclease [Polyangia bacterium]